MGLDDIMQKQPKSIEEAFRDHIRSKTDLNGEKCHETCAESQNEPETAEDRYRKIVENSTEGIIVVQDGKTAYANRTAYSMTEGRLEQLLRDPFSFIHPGDRERLREKYERLLKKEEFPDDNLYRATGTQGNIRWIDIKSTLIEWGGRSATLNNIRDITEKMESRLLLQMQRDLISLLSETNDLKKGAEIIIDAITSIPGLDSGMLYHIEQKTGELRSIAYKGLSEGFAEKVSSFDRQSSQAMLVMQGMPVYSDYVSEFGIKDDVKLKEGIRHIGVIPIRYNNQVVAALNAATKTRDSIPDNTRNALEAIAMHMGGTIARLNAEHSLKVNEEKYRQLFEHAPAGIYKLRYGTGGRVWFSEANEVMLDLTGYSMEEFLRLDPDDLLTDEDSRRILHERTGRRNMQMNIPNETELMIKGRDGKRRWLYITSNRTYGSNGNPVESTGVAHDITEKKKAIEELNTRLRYEKAISEISHHLLDRWRSKNVLDDVLGILQKTTGVSRVYLFEILRDDNETYACQTNEVCEEGTAPQIDNPALKRIPLTGSGYDRWERMLSSGEYIAGKINRLPPEEKELLESQEIRSILIIPINVNCELRHFIGFDDTKEEREWKEEDIMLLSAGAGMIGSYFGNRETEKEKQDLEKRLIRSERIEAIGTLAGGIAHDFNNRLMAIKGNVEIIREHSGKDSQITGRLEKIGELADGGARLTKQLLGFARGGKYEVRPASINDIVRESSEMLEKTAKGISISTMFTDQNLVSDVDSGQITHALMNIYVNALHAMPNGGNLQIRTEYATISRRDAEKMGLNTGRYAKISITDTGIGMGPEIKKRVFEPFFTTRHNENGTGLGLASAYGIISNHGGTIDVSSEPGTGSTFTIYLPYTEKKLEPAKTSDGAKKRGKGTILIVDDEEDVRDVTTSMLDHLGYKVIGASSGMEAIEEYKKHTEDISMVLLDMIMPNMDGEQTYARLRDIDPDVHVLIYSGYSADDKAKRMIGHGCGFMQKPFGMTELSDKVRDIMNLDHAEKTCHA